MSSEVSLIPGEALEAGNSRRGRTVFGRGDGHQWAGPRKGEGRAEVEHGASRCLSGDGNVHSRDRLEEEVAALCVAWAGKRKPKMSLKFLVCMARRDVGLMGGASSLDCGK